MENTKFFRVFWIYFGVKTWRLEYDIGRSVQPYIRIRHSIPTLNQEEVVADLTRCILSAGVSPILKFQATFHLKGL